MLYRRLHCRRTSFSLSTITDHFLVFEKQQIQLLLSTKAVRELTSLSAGNNVKNTGLHIHLDSIIMSNICWHQIKSNRIRKIPSIFHYTFHVHYGPLRYEWQISSEGGCQVPACFLCTRGVTCGEFALQSTNCVCTPGGGLQRSITGMATWPSGLQLSMSTSTHNEGFKLHLTCG